MRKESTGPRAHEATRKDPWSRGLVGSILLEVACKPDSVPRRRGDGHSSGTVVAGGLKRPTRRPRPGQPWNASLFGLAPQGVFRAFPVTGEAVGSYPAFSPLPAAPEGEAGGIFSVALSVGSLRPAVSRLAALWSPDFPLRVTQRPSGHLHPESTPIKN